MSKINSISAFTPAVPEAKERVERETHKKKEGQQQKHSNQDTNQNAGSGQNESFEEKLESEIIVTDEVVSHAIDSFSKDAQSKSNGLSAAQEGSGPGLKVVLKDGSGAVIRQFSGEEFLKLRQAATKDVKSRGKILDQKF